MNKSSKFIRVSALASVVAASLTLSVVAAPTPTESQESKERPAGASPSTMSGLSDSGASRSADTAGDRAASQETKMRPDSLQTDSRGMNSKSSDRAANTSNKADDRLSDATDSKNNSAHLNTPAEGTERTEGLTPIDQSNAEADLKNTQNIRKGLVDDKDLSVSAHNVKIITTKEHKTYLRGEVKNASEHASVVAIAKKNASAGYEVIDELTIQK